MCQSTTAWKQSLWALWLCCGLSHALAAAPYADRFVWVFGWSLDRDTDAAEISRLLDTAAEHGCNGAVVSFGLDTLCQKSPDFFRRLEEVKRTCERDKLELIPAIFSVGYGGAALAHQRNLAEGLPVEDAPFVVRSGEARLAPDPAVKLANGGFEEFTGNRFAGFNFHDQPGEISFADARVKQAAGPRCGWRTSPRTRMGMGASCRNLKCIPAAATA